MPVPEQSVARDVLRDVLDESGQKREVFAAVIGCDDGLLGKKLHGTNGRDIGLGELECLDRDIQVRWMKRYGKLLGLEVSDISAVAIAEGLIEQFDLLLQHMKRARLLDIGKPTQAKAELPVSHKQRSA